MEYLESNNKTAFFKTATVNNRTHLSAKNTYNSPNSAAVLKPSPQTDHRPIVECGCRPFRDLRDDLHVFSHPRPSRCWLNVKTEALKNICVVCQWSQQTPREVVESAVSPCRVSSLLIPFLSDCDAIKCLLVKSVDIQIGTDLETCENQVTCQNKKLAEKLHPTPYFANLFSQTLHRVLALGWDRI